jgi:uncharacterized protein with HEPN domain
MQRDDLVRMRHMLDAARDALAFTVGKKRSDLDKDRMLAFAIMKAIEIIGEAASKISSEARDQCDDIPWTDIISMRHRLIHAYVEVDLDILWLAVKDDLPPLINALEKIIESKQH